MTTDTPPPKWAIKAANEIIGERPEHIPPIYWLDTRDAIARALAATAERVERDTIERCADHVRGSDLSNTGLPAPWTVRVEAEIRSLPSQYQEPTDD